MIEYVELNCRSYFSLLDGASSPEDLAARASELGMPALALTDRDGLYGAIRFWKTAREAGIAPILGMCVSLEDGSRLTLLARSNDGWRSLCRLATASRADRPKGMARTTLATIEEHAEGLLALSGGVEGRLARLIETNRPRDASREAARLRELFRDEFYVEVQRHLTPHEDALAAASIAFAREERLPAVATNGVVFARAEDKRIHDVLTAVRCHTTLAQAGTRLLPNAEYRMKSGEEMAALFPRALELVATSADIAARCQVALDRIPFRLPSFPVPEGQSEFNHLFWLVQEGVRERYTNVTSRVVEQVARELGLIEKLGLAGYFLIVWDICHFCRRNEILVQGRGSAANSVVCYALGITAVDPIALDLLFERFLSEGRTEPPDIDIDIAHQERERVIQYVYERYGRERAAMVCEVITYRGRSAVRDIGKTLGLTLDQVDAISKLSGFRWRLGDDGVRSAAVAAGLDPDDRRLQLLGELVPRFEDTPRHLSIHVGGMIISEQPLADIVPIEPAAMPGRTVIAWDKDDSAMAGLVKIDLLGLGMLSLIAAAIRLVRETKGIEINLARLGCDDPEVYDMICKADTIGVFQIESRAQMSTLPRVKPRCFYDLVVEVALIRPGPIQGGIVHPFLRRRAGREPVTYPHPSLEPILSRTLGVPLFQEQLMKTAVVAAGFTPSEADRLRRAMGSKRSRKAMEEILERLRDGMRSNEYDDAAIDSVLNQIIGFAEYGFPESHAASFALLVYASAYLKRYHPAEFYCALLNSQPMGFYSPATIAGDARRHGVRFLPVSMNHSAWDSTMEDGAVRCGLRMVRGIGEAERRALERVLDERPFANAEAFAESARAAGVSRRAIGTLARAGAFGGENRRDDMWVALHAGRATGGPLAAGKAIVEPAPAFPRLSPLEDVALDLAATGISVDQHPMEFLRERLDRAGVLPASMVTVVKPGSIVDVAGVVICRQRPPTAKGMLFLTLEDESGLINVAAAPQTVERFEHPLLRSPVLRIRGKVQREATAVSILAHMITELRTGASSPRSRDFR